MPNIQELKVEDYALSDLLTTIQEDQGKLDEQLRTDGRIYTVGKSMATSHQTSISLP